MSNGLICALTGYCPAPLAPDNAQIGGRSNKNGTISYQVTVEQAKALPVMSNCGYPADVIDKARIKRITMEEPINQPSFMSSKSVIIAIEKEPKTNKDGGTEQTVYYCSHRPSRDDEENKLYPYLYVTNSKSEKGGAVTAQTAIGPVDPFGTSFNKTTTEMGGETYRQFETKYEQCSGSCMPTTKETYEKYGESRIPHFVDGKLVRE